MTHERHRRGGVEVRELQVLVAREQLPQNDPQAVDVGASVGDLAPRLFGRQVGRAPEHHARRRVLLLEHAAREAEVRQLHLSEVAEQDVRRRDVPMDEVQIAVAVHVGERPRDLAPEVEGDVERDAGARADAAVPDLAQVLPLDQLHGDEELAVHLARVEGRDQVRVGEAQDHLGLVQESVRLGRVGLLRDHLLDDAELLESGLAGGRQIDFAHPAPRHRLEQNVLAESARVDPCHRHQSKES